MLSCDENVSVCGIVTTCLVAELGAADTTVTFSWESSQAEVEATTFSQESSQIGVEATTYSQESSQTGVEASEVVSTASLLIRASPTTTLAVSCGFSLVFLGWLGPSSESENAPRLS